MVGIFTQFAGSVCIMIVDRCSCDGYQICIKYELLTNVHIFKNIKMTTSVGVAALVSVALTFGLWLAAMVTPGWFILSVANSKPPAIYTVRRQCLVKFTKILHRQYTFYVNVSITMKTNKLDIRNTVCLIDFEISFKSIILL